MCIHYGAIPSKTLREAILYFTGFYHRQVYGIQRRRDLTMQDLLVRCGQVAESETRIVIAQLARNRVEVIEGQAVFEDEHTLKISGVDCVQSISADRIIIATGAVPARPASVPFEDGVIVDTIGIGSFTQPSYSLIVVGAGVSGTEYASMLALLDIEVTVIDQKSTLLDFVDREIAEALAYHMRDVGITLYLGEEVVSIEKTNSGRVRITLKSGKKVVADALLYAVGRCGATDMLGLEELDIERDERGRIVVNEHFQTQ